ncbi:LPP20 family lipoprotein [Sporomusa sp.]|uniref:LPP20 family lipoprotein n=1 Tax=Sporomusa sp. TaxID=2078658 RepID=UPI002CF79BEE|nr:LPP20 family lipoprotein [Sporomusa sp.]HWR43377.1 LPP20 family lipoprotein [Sporomusa sp.]
MFKKSLVYLTIFTLLIAGLPMVAGAATVNTNVNVSVSTVDQVGANGSVNWDEGFVEAIGTGVPSSIAKSPAQARLMARRAAIVDAQRNLLESVEGVKVTAETTVQNFETTNDTVKTQVSGIVKGARIVNEHQLADGTYQVTLRINLYGKGSLAEVITDATKPITPVPVPSPSPSYYPVALPVYTGLVVDVSGLPLERAMSPVIFDDTGRAIYGHINIIPEFAVSQGMIDYMFTPEDIRALELGQSRAGATPIMAKAIGLRDHNVNIIISQADADKILAANAQGNFLPKAMVCVRQ